MNFIEIVGGFKQYSEKLARVMYIAELEAGVMPLPLCPFQHSCTCITACGFVFLAAVHVFARLAILHIVEEYSECCLLFSQRVVRDVQFLYTVVNNMEAAGNECCVQWREQGSSA
jgi:hypothetical protein